MICLVQSVIPQDKELKQNWFSFCLHNSGISASSDSGGRWCVADKGASKSDLQAALDYACGKGGADCSQIQPGAICYERNTLIGHASYAFNDYYQKHPVPTSCVFGGTAKLTSKDPSNGKCHYASSCSSSLSPPTPDGNQPSPPSPGSYPWSPPTPSNGSPNPSGFAIPPPGSNSAASALHSPSLLFACLLVLLQVAIHI